MIVQAVDSIVIDQTVVTSEDVSSRPESLP